MPWPRPNKFVDGKRAHFEWANIVGLVSVDGDGLIIENTYYPGGQPMFHIAFNGFRLPHIMTAWIYNIITDGDDWWYLCHFMRPNVVGRLTGSIGRTEFNKGDQLMVESAIRKYVGKII